MPTHNLAIMFTDIKGFTARVSGGKRDDLKHLLSTHERLLAPVITYYEGTIVKTIGDSFLARFSSPTDAVLCGVTIQEVLRQHNAFAPENERLAVRVAINAGDVEVLEGDVVGEAVNLASRLEGIAEAGEVYFTEAVYLAMNRREAPSTEIGERTFAGIPYPVRVFKVLSDPNSELARRVTAGVRVTEQGPVFRGLHEGPAGRRGRWLWAVAAVAAALPAGIWIYHAAIPQKQVLPAKTSEIPSSPPAKTSPAQTPPAKTPLATAPPPTKPDLLAEGRKRLDYLAKSQGPVAALEWLNKRLEQSPELEPLRDEIPVLEARATGDYIVQKSLRGEQMAEVATELLARYPKSAAVPVTLARALEGKVSPAYYPVALYDEAIQRGADARDPHIREFCLGLLPHYWPGWLDKTHDVLQRYYDAEALAWAQRTADQDESGVSLANAWRILKRHNDPRLADPYYQALVRAVDGYANEAEADRDLGIFRQVTDKNRQRHVLSVYRWVFKEDKAVGSFGYSHTDLARRNLSALEALWGAP